MAAGVRREFGRLDCFVANAGIWPPEEVPLGELAARAVARHHGGQPRRGVPHAPGRRCGLMGAGGRVVIVSSTAGQRGEAYHSDYAATKGALIALTKSLADRVRARHPGQLRGAGLGGHRDVRPAFAGEGRERIAATIPLRRIPPPEDIAGPILFLCSDLARHVTGEVLNVNGGSVLCG